MSDHAPLAPSFAPVWGHCSGAPAACANEPNLETNETRRGTAGHWVGAEVLERYRQGVTHRTAFEYVGQRAPNGVVIDHEIAEGAQQYIDDVLETAQRFNAVDKLMVEQRVHMPDIHPQNWGTFDGGLYLPDRRTLFLWDYKAGRLPRQPADCFQLADYAKGLANELGLDGHAQQQTTLVMRIVQPYCYDGRGTVREHVCKLSDLRAMWNTLRTKAEEVFTKPLLTAGPHCRYCPALRKCSTGRKYVTALLDFADQPFVMDDLKGSDLAVERRMLTAGISVAQKRLEAIEDQLQHAIRAGDSSTGLTVQATEGRLKWNDDTTPQRAAALAAMFGVDASKPGVMTPTQTIAAAPKEVRPALKSALAAFTNRPTGALKLVEVENTISAKAFKRS